MLLPDNINIFLNAMGIIMTRLSDFCYVFKKNNNKLIVKKHGKNNFMIKYIINNSTNFEIYKKSKIEHILTDNLIKII